MQGRRLGAHDKRRRYHGHHQLRIAHQKPVCLLGAGLNHLDRGRRVCAANDRGVFSKVSCTPPFGAGRAAVAAAEDKNLAAVDDCHLLKALHGRRPVLRVRMIEHVPAPQVKDGVVPGSPAEVRQRRHLKAVVLPKGGVIGVVGGRVPAEDWPTMALTDGAR